MATDKRDMRPKGIYHVYNRGSNKMNLFRETEDYVYFIKKMKHYKEKYDFKIYSSCLMTNHFHIIVQDSGLDLSVFMDALESVFATYFIDKYKYKGRVFESRFKSSLILTNTKLLGLFRYLARNPIVARIVNNIFSYPWSTPSQQNDTFGIVDFEFINEVFRLYCKQSLVEFLESSVDDFWIDPIEAQRFDNSEAHNLYDELLTKMVIDPNNFTSDIHIIQNARFFNICHQHGITKKQLSEFSGLSHYRMKKFFEAEMLF